MTALQNLSQRVLIAIFAGTIAVLTAATWFILIAPKHAEASSLDAQIQAAQTQLSLRRHATTTKKTDGATEALRVHRAMPDTTAMPQVILELNRVAAEEHVSVDSITPGGATVFAGYYEAPMVIVVSGSFYGVEGFLHELRNQVRLDAGNILATGRLFDVQGVTLSQTAPAPKVTATLNVDAYAYTGAPAPVAPTTPGAASATSGGTG